MITKEERAELRELTKAADGEWRVLSPGELVFANDATNWAGSTEREEYTVLAIAAVNAMPVLLDALDAADERIAGLEAELGKLKGRNCDDANHGLTMTHQCVACSRIENCEERIAQLESWGREDCGPLKARIAELEAAAQWRPMATVPTDGTHVVVCMGFRDGAPHFETRRYIAPPLLGRSTSTHWRWLPIPALPEGGV